ncbi:hypothetical protein HID58_076891 [Brassica napus]|uniref:ATPase AAA-type core domain-containing protein n=1 Tax=Brassica napus TaxID=3708 RepID=A0ABQ7YNT4_BRANA|nr:hypothetical protein HID58_076891 [Brassica napus]
MIVRKDQKLLLLQTKKSKRNLIEILMGSIVKPMFGDNITTIGSNIAGLLFIIETLRRYFPVHLKITIQELLVNAIQRLPFFKKCSDKTLAFFSPYTRIRFIEIEENKYNYAYSAIKTYLGAQVNPQVKNLKGSQGRGRESLDFKRDDDKFEDEYDGVKMWWEVLKSTDGVKMCRLTFHRSNWEVVTGSYLRYVGEEGKSIEEKKKKVKLFMNNPSSNWKMQMKNLWSSIDFEHPATFDTMAMDPKKKDEIMRDLLAFRDSEEILVFTTNHLGKLDQALIRRGRMDMHIELSYCRFEAFKILAKNYLNLDSHLLFGEIETLLEETNMTPADVAENLMVKDGESSGGDGSLKGSTLATLMFTYTIFRRWFPHVGDHLEPFFQRLFSRFYPYIQIKFHEYSGEHFKRSEVYSGIQSYLSKDSSLRAKKLKANTTKGSKSLVLSMDDREEITDEFESVTVWWQSKKVRNTRQSFSFYPAADEKRYYTLKFHRRDREVIIERYLEHVVKEGKRIKMKNRERKLYSNTPGQNHRNQTKWSHVTFEHPASFDTLAMEEEKKEEIKNDLVKFSKSKDYYKKIGKAWKRGEGEKKESKVTLSGLLNFIDGLWSACGGERIIVFTTNFVDKLDPALIRKGRMDKHIEMSYCGFEAFKVLAKNYLDVEEKIKMTPADVGENLLPKSEGKEGETCLKRLVEALKEAKEEAKKKHFSLFHLKHIQNFVQPCLSKTNLLQGWGQRWECRYERAKEELFCFKGMGPEELKQKLEEETALNYISICSKNPLNGILRLHLPPNNTKMNVVLFPSSSSKG